MGRRHTRFREGQEEEPGTGEEYLRALISIWVVLFLKQDVE